MKKKNKLITTKKKLGLNKNSFSSLTVLQVFFFSFITEYLLSYNFCKSNLILDYSKGVNPTFNSTDQLGKINFSKKFERL